MWLNQGSHPDLPYDWTMNVIAGGLEVCRFVNEKCCQEGQLVNTDSWYVRVMQKPHVAANDSCGLLPVQFCPVLVWSLLFNAQVIIKCNFLTTQV